VTAQATSFPRVVRVRAGDSLWAIAERHLPAGAPDSAVEAGWRLLADANADRIGHPDLIFPGTVLRVPPLDGTRPSTH
jgi:nucleoid-associated protein YgaU